MGLRVSFAMNPDFTRHVVAPPALDRLREACEVISADPLTDLSGPAARDQLARSDVLVTGWGCPRIGPEILTHAPDLKLIAHAAGTVKEMIAPEIYAAGVQVTHAADANAIPVAEFTLAAILFANKKVLTLRDLYCRDRGRKAVWPIMDSPIGNTGKVIGLIGASRIGRRVADLLKPFDFEVLLHDPYVAPGDPVLQNAALADLDTLLARSDVVSLHAPALPETRDMLGAAQFARMRDGATFINTARGMLVDHDAMIAELETGRIDAVIDVTDPEIPAPDSRLWSLPNVLLTPHVAGAAGVERSRLGDMAIDEVLRFARGEPLLYAVTPDRLKQLA